MFDLSVRSSSELAANRGSTREAIEYTKVRSSVILGMRLVEALQSSGDAGKTESLLVELISTGISAGIFRRLVDGGAAVHALLRELYGNCEANIRELAAGPEIASRRTGGPVQIAFARRVSQTLPGEALSERECAVLQLIGQGLSNKRIAYQLSIAPETVKSHAKHIFLKLGTQTRAQAVARAARLGLL